MTKALRDEIDGLIYESEPALFEDYTDASNINGTEGEWNIPRLHVDDLKHYLGTLADDIPTRYKRRTGNRDIDTVAAEMGYDDIDGFIDEIQRVLDVRAEQRANNTASKTSIILLNFFRLRGCFLTMRIAF